MIQQLQEFPASGSTVTITMPSADENCFDYMMSTGPNSRFRGRLSYDILEGGGTRSILRVDYKDASRTFRNLHTLESCRNLFQRVEREQSQLGNIRLAKHLAVALTNSAARDPDLTVTVHRFGAVPIALLPEMFQVPLGEQQVDVRVGVFKTGSGVSEAGKDLSEIDLLRSFRDLHLDRVLQTYLEDVAEECHDLQHLSSTANSFERLKRIEATLKESIGQKIELILSGIESANRFTKQFKLASEIWEKYSQEVISASLVRPFVLYFVNQLYRALGVEDRSDKYEQRWNLTLNRLSKLIPEHDFERLFDDYIQGPAILKSTLLRYTAQGAFSEFGDLLDVAQPGTWLGEFVQFAEFCHRVRSEKSDPGKARIFLAAQHQIDAARHFVSFANQNVPLLPNQRPAAVFVQVHESQAGKQFERLIKTRIWQGDAVIGIIPENWDAPRADGRAPLDWILSETEHAKLLRKNLVFATQQGVSLAAIEAEIDKGIKFLADAKNRLDPVKRRDELKKHIGWTVVHQFKIESDNVAPPSIEFISEAVLTARKLRSRDLIDGFLKFFPDKHRKTIARVLAFLNRPASKFEIGEALARGFRLGSGTPTQDEVHRQQKEFTAAWDLLRTRRLFLSNRPFPLILRDGQEYRENLAAILKVLWPDQSESDHRSLRKSVLSSVLGEGEVDHWGGQLTERK
jgi:hypothetical protein